MSRLPFDLVEPVTMLVAGIAILAFLRMYASDTAGGSDSYGYVSEALRLTRGHLYEVEHVLSVFGLPENSELTHPLGYVPRGMAGTVPTYPFGYPLLMAIAIQLLGFAAAFWVTPLLATGAVLSTYVAGRWYLGRLGGFLAAAAVFLLPNFLLGALPPMSDVPATFFAALALVPLLQPRPRAWTDVLLAMSEGFAIWVRPNTALIVIPTVLWLMWLRQGGRLIRFVIALLPFIAVEAVVNQYLYGSPTVSGYGQLLLAPTLVDALDRGIRHLSRLQDQQAGVGLFLVAFGLAFGRLPLALRVLLVSVAGAFLIFFAFYAIDDAWWYGRFLLPGLPAVALLEASAVVRLGEPGPLQWPRRAAIAVGLILFAWSSIGYARANFVFQQAEGEMKYQTAARFVQARVRQPALVLAGQHSGSLRLYGGLATARYDTGSLPTLLSTLGQVTQDGGTVYLVGEGWEIEDIRRGGRAILLAGAQNLGYVEPSHVTLFRLNVPLDPGDVPAQNRTHADFGNQLALRGYDLSSIALRPGEELTVTLYWQALKVPDDNYTVFIHLVDAQGKIVTQSDSYPVEGRYPTSAWQVGYVISDVHRLSIPAGTTGSLQVEAGLYRLDTMQRLALSDQSGPHPTDLVALGAVHVGP